MRNRIHLQKPNNKTVDSRNNCMSHENAIANTFLFSKISMPYYQENKHSQFCVLQLIAIAEQVEARQMLQGIISYANMV